MPKYIELTPEVEEAIKSIFTHLTLTKPPQFETWWELATAEGILEGISMYHYGNALRHAMEDAVEKD